MSYTLRGDPAWDDGFLKGLEQGLAAFALPLLGGDTVSIPAGAPRSFGLTAIGQAGDAIPSRAGAQAGDTLWVSGTIGDSAAGLELLSRGATGPFALIERYRRPTPRLAAGRPLAPLVSAMMDVSDGLLIDAGRMASASGARIAIDLARVPLSAALVETVGSGREVRTRAATAGDDYELLFAAPHAAAQEIAAIAQANGLALTAIGHVEPGAGLVLHDQGDLLALPEMLGWEHR